MNAALQNSVVIRWRTNVATNSKVSFGTTPGSLTQSATNNTSTTEHVLKVTGLSANTLYYYNIGSGICPPPTDCFSLSLIEKQE